MDLLATSTNDLNRIADSLLEFSKGCRFFIFNGEMGAGKTTFIKSLCERLGVEDVVSSPTFSIVNEYWGKNAKVYHFDFYRLKNIQEAYDLGYEEYFYSPDYCLVEWPEKVDGLMPENVVQVDITVVDSTTRKFTFKALD